MNIRGLELFEKDSGRSVYPEYLIGVDETGTHNVSGPFAVTAVLCPRTVEPRLAEMMIDAGMNLWKEKPKEELFVQSDLLEFMQDHSEISWFAIGSTAPISKEDKAAIAITAAMYTLIQPNISRTYSVDQAALIHDGSDTMYGKKQRLLREQSSAQIDSEFTSNFGKILLTQTSRGDQIYPTVMLADLISGQVCKRISNGDLDDVTNYEWFRDAWVENPKGPADDLYYLNEAGTLYPDYLWENYAAWLTGKASANNDGPREGIPIETLIERSADSEVVIEYLRENRN